MYPIARIACVFTKNLPIQVEHARRNDNASLLIPHPVNFATVFAASDDLIRAGVEISMSLYQAQQIAPTAIVITPDEAAYHAKHDSIVTSLKTFSAAIETVMLGECLLDVRGLEKLLAGERSLTEMIQKTAAQASGLSVQVGIATGKFTAQQAAREAPTNGVCVVKPGDEAHFLSSLPITVLPHLPGEMRRRLTLFDIYTLGDLAALSKAAVLRQFGAEVSSLYDLARGHDPRPLHADSPPLRLVRSVTLIEPMTNRQSIFNVLTLLSSRLSRALSARGYHTEALKVVINIHSQQSDTHLECGQAVKPPTADEARLSRIAMHLFGKLDNAAPVMRLSLIAYPLRSWHASARQLTFVSGDNPERQGRFDNALHTIWNRFGQMAIQIASFLVAPAPRKTQVMLNTEGLPMKVTLAGQVWDIVGVDEHWREERLWWSRPVRRDYFRVILSDGSLRNIFQNLIDGEWYLDRAFPLL